MFQKLLCLLGIHRMHQHTCNEQFCCSCRQLWKFCYDDLKWYKLRGFWAKTQHEVARTITKEGARDAQ